MCQNFEFIGVSNKKGGMAEYLAINERNVLK